jgi:hypothetical protein
MNHPAARPLVRRLLLNTAAFAAAILLAAVAVVAGIAGHDEPAARFVVVECQGFEALASTGSDRATCDAAPAETEGAEDVRPVDGPAPATVSGAARTKA